MWALDGGSGRDALEKIVVRYLKRCGRVELDAWDVYRCIKGFTIEHKLCCSYLFGSYSTYNVGYSNPYDAWREDLESEIGEIVRDCHGRILSSIEDVKPYLYKTDDIVVPDEEVDKQLLGESILSVLKHEKRIGVFEYDGHFEFIDKGFCARCIAVYIWKKKLCCECLFDKPGYFSLRNKIKLLTPDVLEKLAGENEFVRKHDPKHDPNPGGHSNISYWFSTKTVIIERLEYHDHKLTEFF